MQKEIPQYFQIIQKRRIAIEGAQSPNEDVSSHRKVEAKDFVYGGKRQLDFLDILLQTKVCFFLEIAE